MTERQETGEQPRSTLERALGIVTDVKGGEGITAVILTLNGFLLLTAYYVIKPVRESLILVIAGGEKYKSYLSGAIALSLLVVVPLYGRAADRVAKDKLVVGVTLFFASHLLIFYALSKSPLEAKLGFVFFVWLGIFSMMLVAQFWSFANDLYTQEQGKRLFALVGIGASAGSAFGAGIAKVFAKTIGTYQLMLVSAAILGGSAALTAVAARRESARKASRVDPAEKGKKPKGDKSESGTFAIVFRHKYLLMIAIFSLLFTLVNTNGEYMLGALVKEASTAAAEAATAVNPGLDAKRFSQDFVTSFYGDFFVWVNVLVLVLQTFVVSRLVKFGGLKLAFFVLPVIALFDAAAVAFIPLLAVIRVGKVVENATDYSVNNTVRNMLWLPTTTEMKYKAKQAVDTFFVRMGDVGSAVLVYAFAERLAWPVRNFALINVGLVAVWIVLAIRIVRENARLSDGGKMEERAAQSSSKNL